jgi:drug/metabolite transporter superfamily protein YnfA
MLRSVGAVISGWLVFAIATGALFAVTGRKPHDPQDTAFVVLSIVYGAVFACLGGFLAATIAGRSAVAHGAGVAVLLAGLALTSALASKSANKWSQIGAVLIMAPAAFLGGFVKGKTRR